MTKIGQDAVGFACAEAGRTVLGCAGGRGVSIQDEAAKKVAEDAVLAFCVKSMKARGDGIRVLLNGLKASDGHLPRLA